MSRCPGGHGDSCPWQFVTHVGHEHRLYCDEHGIARDRRAVAILAFDDEGSVLGVTRRDNHEDWGKPGGSVEPEDENDWQAAARELLEECGCVVESRDLDVVYAGWDDAGNWTTTFYAGTFTGTPTRPESDGGKPAGLVGYVPRERLTSGSFGTYNQRVFDAWDSSL